MAATSGKVPWRMVAFFDEVRKFRVAVWVHDIDNVREPTADEKVEAPTANCIVTLVSGSRVPARETMSKILADIHTAVDAVT